MTSKAVKDKSRRHTSAQMKRIASSRCFCCVRVMKHAPCVEVLSSVLSQISCDNASTIHGGSEKDDCFLRKYQGRRPTTRLTNAQHIWYAQPTCLFMRIVTT